MAVVVAVRQGLSCAAIAAYPLGGRLAVSGRLRITLPASLLLLLLLFPLLLCLHIADSAQMPGLSGNSQIRMGSFSARTLPLKSQTSDHT